MSLSPAKIAALSALFGALALSACTQTRLGLSPDFGQAVRRDSVAQIADPDAHYLGMPAPGANGQRVGLAQKHYDKNEVIQPSAVGSTGSITSAGGGSTGGGGAGDSTSSGSQ